MRWIGACVGVPSHVDGRITVLREITREHFFYVYRVLGKIGLGPLAVGSGDAPRSHGKNEEQASEDGC